MGPIWWRKGKSGWNYVIFLQIKISWGGQKILNFSIRNGDFIKFKRVFQKFYREKGDHIPSRQKLEKGKKKKKMVHTSETPHAKSLLGAKFESIKNFLTILRKI